MARARASSPERLFAPFVEACPLDRREVVAELLSALRRAFNETLRFSGR
jgi:hypothetical protein